MAEFTFEKGMEELEGIVKALEGGSMPLEESFGAYKRGVEVYKELKRLLDEGEARVKLLTKDGESDITGGAGAC